MTPAEQITAFIRHVTDSTTKFTESRSSLRNLLAWLRKPENQHTPLAGVAAAKARCADPNDARLAKYDAPLRSLVAVWGTSRDYDAGTAGTAIPETGGGDVMALIRAARLGLEQCRNYACNDVGAFPQCVNRGLTKARQEEIKHRKPLRTGLPLLVASSGDWNAAALHQAFTNANLSQAGECTTYAYYAGHVLGTTPISGRRPRLEIVSWEGEGRAKHCFVVVGRTGPRSPSGHLPTSDKWNRDARIVDCWALTLGHGYLYTADDYCFQAMLDPSKIIMDSTVTRVSPTVNSQGGLKSTGLKRW